MDPYINIVRGRGGLIGNCLISYVIPKPTIHSSISYCAGPSRRLLLSNVGFTLPAPTQGGYRATKTPANRISRGLKPCEHPLLYRIVDASKLCDFCGLSRSALKFVLLFPVLFPASKLALILKGFRAVFVSFELALLPPVAKD